MLPVIYCSITEDTKILDISHALSSPQRLNILKLLQNSSMNVKEIATFLNEPISSTSLNVEVLAQSGLIEVKTRYSKTGKSKHCSRSIDGVSFRLFEPQSGESKKLSTEIPIGSYMDYVIKPSCGIVTAAHPIGLDNDIDSFFNPARFDAKLLWFSGGFLEYRISKKGMPNVIKELEISFETCSEAPFYRNDWKSDLTVWVNNVEIGTWTCPGDFGGRKGKQNPDWWPDALTQYGILTNWVVTENGSHMNGLKLGETTLKSLNLEKNPYISLKIGLKDDARFRGGINLFGAAFGDYKQDIVVKMNW